MPKYMVYATEEVLYMREVEANNQAEAKKIFMNEIEHNDIVDTVPFCVFDYRQGGRLREFLR